MQNYNMERMQCHCEDKNPREEERNLAFPYVMWQKDPDMYENLEEALCIHRRLSDVLYACSSDVPDQGGSDVTDRQSCERRGGCPEYCP